MRSKSQVSWASETDFSNIGSNLRKKKSDYTDDGVSDEGEMLSIEPEVDIYEDSNSNIIDTNIDIRASKNWETRTESSWDPHPESSQFRGRTSSSGVQDEKDKDKDWGQAFPGELCD